MAGTGIAEGVSSTSLRGRQGVLAHLLHWADARLVAAVEVEPPEAVKGRLEEQVRYSYTTGPVRVTLAQLVGWLREGLHNARLNGVPDLWGRLAPQVTTNR